MVVQIGLKSKRKFNVVGRGSGRHRKIKCVFTNKAIPLKLPLITMGTIKKFEYRDRWC